MSRSISTIESSGGGHIPPRKLCPSPDKLAVSVCYALYLALSMLVCPSHQSMRFFQFSFRAMEQIKTGILLNPHPVGGRLIVVNETEALKTRSALALQDILKIGTHARSRETWEVGKQLLDVQILIISLLMSSSIGRRLPSSLRSSYDSIPSTFLHHQDFTQLASLSTLPSNSTFLLYSPCEEAILGWGNSVNL